MINRLIWGQALVVAASASFAAGAASAGGIGLDATDRPSAIALMETAAVPGVVPAERPVIGKRCLATAVLAYV